MMKNEENAKEKISSGSRLRNNVSKIFECFLIVTRSESNEKGVQLDFKYPPNFNDAEILHQSSLFCFPFDSSPETIVQFKDHANHYTFILTDIEGKHRFGFCKLTNEASKCYCLLSFLPWFEIFYKILNYVHELSMKANEETIETMLMELQQQSIPNPLERIQISATLSFSTPDGNSLPSIPENINLSEYYSAVNSTFMMEIFASIMFERRIIFTSNSLSVLASCIHSSEALLKPLHWQHIFIPIMPLHLLDYCLAPMPYLVGIHSSLMKKAHSIIAADDDIILANLDKEEIESIHSDLERIPNDTMSFLKSQLRKPTVAMGSNLSTAFLRTQVRLIGGYRNGLRFRPDEPICFDPDKFIDSYKSNTTKEFARSLVQLQAFKQFVDGRLDMLNAGIGFRDEFENEVNMIDAAGGLERDTYKEWLNSAKKGGNKLIMQFQRKAKDNMKGAQQSVRNYIKQQQLKQEASVNRKKSLAETPQRIRPSRPPPIAPETLALHKARRGNTVPPPLPLTGPPKPPFRKKNAIRRTRHYTELDLDYTAGTSGNDGDLPPYSSLTRERCQSEMTYSELDLDIMTDIQQAMEEKITKLASVNEEDHPQPAHELLLDLNSTSNTAEDDTESAACAQESSIGDRSTSEIRRRARVSTKPSGIRKSVPTEQAYSSDDPSPEVESATNQLIDLSVSTHSPAPRSPSPNKANTATADLLGLNFSSLAAEEPASTSVTTPSNWANFNVSNNAFSNATPSKNPFSVDQKEAIGPSKSGTIPFHTATAQSSGVSSNPFLTGSIIRDANRTTPPSKTHKLSPKKLGPFTPNANMYVANSGGNDKAFSSPLHGASKLPVQRSFSTQTLSLNNSPIRANHFGANTRMVTGASSFGNRAGSLRNQPESKTDGDLFSDLLGTWKSREGM